ncbi:hypothetical protein chiPu_0028573, partial [Chiloscyllium punctatum]|nr:hypothetical protein [Chiloscyllium punctatum]
MHLRISPAQLRPRGSRECVKPEGEWRGRIDCEPPTCAPVSESLTGDDPILKAAILSH